MAGTRSLIKESLLARIQSFEAGLREEEDPEAICQWVRTPTSGGCHHKGAVYIIDPPMFARQQPKEVIICHDCIKHFTNGIRKRWRL